MYNNMFFLLIIFSVKKTQYCYTIVLSYTRIKIGII